jgi:hypothetical protein
VSTATPVLALLRRKEARAKSSRQQGLASALETTCELAM